LSSENPAVAVNVYLPSILVKKNILPVDNRIAPNEVFHETESAEVDNYDEQ
jgi:hypothetical protein